MGYKIKSVYDKSYRYYNIESFKQALHLALSLTEQFNDTVIVINEMDNQILCSACGEFGLSLCTSGEVDVP